MYTVYGGRECETCNFHTGKKNILCGNDGVKSGCESLVWLEYEKLRVEQF